jgi:hypothetical protein
MTSIEKLTSEIQQLENDYANHLADGMSPDKLNKIWKRILELRNHKQVLEMATAIDENTQ